MTLPHAALVDPAPSASVDVPCASRDDARAFLGRALTSRPGPMAVIAPAPSTNGLGMLSRLRKSLAFHVSGREGSLTTLGAVRSLATHGASRFADAAAFMTHASNLPVHAHDRSAQRTPLLTSGFAFAHSARRDVWEPFGDGHVTLPRWAHRVERGRGSLVFVRGEDDTLDPSFALAELDAIWDAITAGPTPEAPSPTARATHVDEVRWTRSIEDVRARIDSGEAQKIVVARRSVVVSEQDLDPIAIAHRLRGPSANLFVVRRQGATFVGATPEHLFQKRGLLVSTEALAGTISLAEDPLGRSLLASAKDRAEHAFVVEAIVERLEGLGAEVSLARPCIRTIGELAHLATRVRATLLREVSPFEITALLHPTPAVAGVPHGAAMEWIREHEPDRGWYAGPVGWVDLEGNAEMLVALRSALVLGARAVAYAGCGIVAASRPHAEYVETGLKLAPMLAALGVR